MRATGRCRCRAKAQYACRGGSLPSAVDLLSAFRIERLVENRRGQIDALADPHGARMRAEQGSVASVLLEQATHCESDGFCLVAFGQLFGRLLDKLDDVRAIDRDNSGHSTTSSLQH